MKKLLSEAAIRAKRIFLAIASFFSTLWAKVLSTFRKSKNAEAKTTYSLNNKSSAGGAGKHVSAAGGKVLSFFKRLPALAVKYRLAVSCIMVVIIGAIVIGVALGGKSSKTFKGDQQALHSSDNPAAVTQSPQNTEPGSADDPAIPTLPKPRHLRQRITSISLPCRSFQCVPLTKQRMLRKQENTTM